jgi:hypothetical protein
MYVDRLFQMLMLVWCPWVGDRYMRLSVLCYARKGNGVELLLWGGFPQFLDGATVGCGSVCCLRICYLHGGLTGISLCCSYAALSSAARSCVFFTYAYPPTPLCRTVNARRLGRMRREKTYIAKMCDMWLFSFVVCSFSMSYSGAIGRHRQRPAFFVSGVA